MHFKYFITFLMLLFSYVLCFDEKQLSDELKEVDKMKQGMATFEKVKRVAVREVQNDMKNFDDARAAKLLNMYNFVQDPTITKLIRGELEENMREKKKFLRRKLRHVKKSIGNKSRMFLKLCLKGARQERMIKRLCKRMAIMGEMASDEDGSNSNVQELLTQLYQWEAKVISQAIERVKYEELATALALDLEEETAKVQALAKELKTLESTTKILSENVESTQAQLEEFENKIKEDSEKEKEKKKADCEEIEKLCSKCGTKQPECDDCKKNSTLCGQCESTQRLCVKCESEKTRCDANDDEIVQLEANEVVRFQEIASAAQHSLEEATTKVRVLSAELQAEQNATNILAENAHNAQMQLAQHDKALFEARQKVSELSNEMVELEQELAGSAIAEIQSGIEPGKYENINNNNNNNNNNNMEDDNDRPEMHCLGPDCL